MGAGSSVPQADSSASALSDDQTLRLLEDGARLFGALTPLRNKFFRTLHCQFRNEEFDSVAKVCYVRDVDLSAYHQRLNIQKQVLTRQNAPNVLTSHRFRYGAQHFQQQQQHAAQPIIPPSSPPSTSSSSSLAAAPSGAASATTTRESSPPPPPPPSHDSAAAAAATSPTFLVRQYLFANLKDRLATRPFLSECEKLWIAHQLLRAVQQLHSCGICHGDIKTENVLLTSWGWAVLADMAPYKPTHLEADQAASAFNFFFSTGKKRCYLAPERFVKSSLDTTTTSTAAALADELEPSMDLFSVGMVLIEMFNVDGAASGQGVFSLSDALEYSARGASERLDELVGKVSHPAVRQMCQSLTSRNPQDRMPVADCLQLLPDCFASFLYPLMHSMLTPASEQSPLLEDALLLQEEADVLVWRTCEAYESILAHLKLADERGSQLCSTLLRTRRTAATAATTAGTTPSSSSSSASSPHVEEEEEFRKVKDIIHKMEAALAVVKAVNEEEEEEDDAAAAGEAPLHLALLPPDNILVVLMSYLGVCVVKATGDMTRVVAMLLLKQFAVLVRSDELTLARVVPFVVHRVSKDNEPSVLCRCVALDVLVELLDSLRSDVPVAEQKYFPDYLFAHVERCSRDASPAVRVAFATHLASIASHAKLFLECARQQQQQQQQAPSVSYDAELNVLRDFVQRMMEKLTAETASSSSTGANGNGNGSSATNNNNNAVDFAVRNALVSNMLPLCLFFGRDRIETWLLPWLLSVFNFWPLQVSVLRSLSSVGAFVGSEAFNMFLYPLLDDMLYSAQDLVVEAAANCVGTLVQHQLIAPKGKLFKLTENIAPLLRHPSVRVRRACLRVLASVLTLVDHVDCQLFLMEHIQPHFVVPPNANGGAGGGGGGIGADVFLLLGRQGMTCQQTLALLDSLTLQPSATSLQRWAKEYNKPFHAAGAAVAAAASASSGGAVRWAGRSSEQQRAAPFPVHALVVDESLGGRVEAQSGTARAATSLTVLYAKYGLVELPNAPPVSGHKLYRRVRALQLPELKYNLARQLPYQPPQGMLPEPAHGGGSKRPEWRIRGNLVTPLLEHTGAVHRIQVAEDSSFFTTGSEDGTVKLWVCAKLDRNPCPKSRITFAVPGGGRVVDLCTIRNTQSFAVASSGGQVSVIRSDGPGDAFRHASLTPSSAAGLGGVVALVAPDANSLVACTERGTLHQWDLRSGSNREQGGGGEPAALVTPGFGSVSCMACSSSSGGGEWLVLGTHRGVVCVYDVRYNLLLAAWRHPYSHAIHRLHVSKSTEGKPLVFVCVGRNQTVLLNVETGLTKLALSCALPEVSGDADTQAAWRQTQERLFTTPFERIDLSGGSRHNVDRYIREAQMAYSTSLPQHSMRAVLVPGDVFSSSSSSTSTLSSVLTAGTDLTVRSWDLNNAAASSLVTAPLDEQKPRWEAKRLTTSTTATTTTAMMLCYSGQKMAPPAHKTTLRFVVRTAHSDAILDLAAVRMRGDSRFLLATAGRDGAVKLWQ